MSRYVLPDPALLERGGTALVSSSCCPRWDAPVPPGKLSPVYLGDVLPYVDGGPLDFAVGLGADGQPVHVDLAELGSLLVTGTMGSGKTTMLNAIVTSFLMRSTPDDVRLILVDPFQDVFGDYSGIPHLVMPVANGHRRGAKALEWCVAEMDRRCRVFSDLDVGDLKGYNDRVDRAALVGEALPFGHLPSIVVVVDYFDALMIGFRRSVGASVLRVAQRGRAAGVHLVLATRSLSDDSVTGPIRVNIASKVIFRVSEGVDSRIAIGRLGAEKLLGFGDMLFVQAAWGVEPRRIQGCYQSDEEAWAVAEHWRRQTGLCQEVGMSPLGELATSYEALDNDEEVAWQAAQLIVREQKSTVRYMQYIQSCFGLGPFRMKRVMDMLEKMGIVGPARGGLPRNIMVHDLGELAAIRDALSSGEK